MQKCKKTEKNVLHIEKKAYICKKFNNHNKLLTPIETTLRLNYINLYSDEESI